MSSSGFQVAVLYHLLLAGIAYPSPLVWGLKCRLTENMHQLMYSAIHIFQVYAYFVMPRFWRGVGVEPG